MRGYARRSPRWSTPRPRRGSRRPPGRWRRDSMGRAAFGLAGALVLAIGLAACAERPIPLSLYSRIGGQAAIVAVVDQLAANVVADRRISGFFPPTHMAPLKAGP